MIALRDWAASFLPNVVLPKAELSLSALSGDAGFRQYFRTGTEPALMAVSAPPEHENTPAFVSKALLMREYGIRVPEVYAVNYQQGFMLLEDLGDTLLLSRLGNSKASDALYASAENALLELQAMPADRDVFADYSAVLLHREMALFPEWFVGGLLELQPTVADRSMLKRVFDTLVTNAVEQPQVVVHRDYHSRNLMLMPDNRIAMIDFQDAVIGPLTYDLVSLLRDCYIRLPANEVRHRALNFARQSGVLADVSESRFIRWFDLMGLQRHLKVLGIFARLSLRDGKPQYLRDLPLVIRYTLEQAKPYPEMAEFVSWFETAILAVLESGQYAWYQPWQTAGDRAGEQ